MEIPKNAILGSGYYAIKNNNGYLVTFDPGSHIPQDVTVFLTESEFETIHSNSTKFDDIVIPAMIKQNIEVI